MAKSQKELILSYFKKTPNRDIKQAEVANWAQAEWHKLTGERISALGSALRALYKTGLLARTARGIYRYDPETAQVRKQINFTAKQKKEIFERDEYKCVACGLGKREGLQIHVAPIYPFETGGECEVINSFTLCDKHYKAKKKEGGIGIGMAMEMFADLQEKASNAKDEKTKKFCDSVLGLQRTLS